MRQAAFTWFDHARSRGIRRNCNILKKTTPRAQVRTCGRTRSTGGLLPVYHPGASSSSGGGFVSYSGFVAWRGRSPQPTIIIYTTRDDLLLTTDGSYAPTPPTYLPPPRSAMVVVPLPPPPHPQPPSSSFRRQAAGGASLLLVAALLLLLIFISFLPLPPTDAT